MKVIMDIRDTIMSFGDLSLSLLIKNSSRRRSEDENPKYKWMSFRGNSADLNISRYLVLSIYNQESEKDERFKSVYFSFFDMHKLKRLISELYEFMEDADSYSDSVDIDSSTKKIVLNPKFKRLKFQLSLATGELAFKPAVAVDKENNTIVKSVIVYVGDTNHKVHITYDRLLGFLDVISDFDLVQSSHSLLAMFLAGSATSRAVQSLLVREE